MTLLCSACLHALDDAGFCENARCVRCPSYEGTGYTVPPVRVTDQPDPFPAEVHCPMCGQPVPAKA